jgi:hypothetical protein
MFLKIKPSNVILIAAVETGTGEEEGWVSHPFSYGFAIN